MRTTLTLDADVADFLREQARLQNRPFKQVVNDTLRRGMSPAAGEERPAYRVKPLRGGFRPGVDPLKLNQLNDELETQEFIGRDGE
ncbi:MAG: antitoxin [Chloroflexi bacterium]|nr:antitoxin [Chloroflexota bacterium]